MTKNCMLICNEINNPTIKRNTAEKKPDNIDSSPDANGLNCFKGCALSELMSSKSFRTYPDDAIKLNAKKPKSDCIIWFKELREGNRENLKEKIRNFIYENINN